MARLVRGPVDLVRRSVEIFLTMDGLDRSMALAAQAFTALVPLLIVVSAVLENGSRDTLGASLVERFDLSGSAADSVERLLPPSANVEDSVNVLGALILIFSALSFTRALQRIYERAWGLEARGVRDAGYGLAWLLMFALYISLNLTLYGSAAGETGLIASVVGSFVVWLVTPYVILARRLPWRTLVPQALVTALGLTAFRAASTIYMPPVVASSAEQFGSIGLAFAIISWLFFGACVLAASAAAGAALSAGASTIHVSARTRLESVEHGRGRAAGDEVRPAGRAAGDD
jgi:membrane protein